MTAASGNFPHTVIRASAGTGKTYQLSNRFIALAAAGQRVDHILAATFARKAAGEILDRVLVRLAEAATDRAKLRELAESIGVSDLDQPRVLSILRELVRRLHRLRIGTLDSFFVGIAGNFSLELGMHPGWQIVEELADRGLRAEAIQEVLRRESTTDLVTLMQMMSKGEVTRSVTEQIRDVVNYLYELFCETPRDAWFSLGRHKQLKPEEVAEAIAAIEAVALPAHKTIANGRKASVHAATIGDWLGFIQGGLPSKIIKREATYCSKPIEPPVVAAFRPLIDHAKAVLVNKLADQTEASWRLLDKFHVAYDRLKHERGSYRFDDLTRLLGRNMGSGDVASRAYRLDAHVSHLLLDEFQDTSLAQWSVMRPFAEQVTQPGDGRSFFCVGDVKQAIYGWRGGLSEIFDAVCSQLPGLSNQSLTKSFRSSQVVIDTVNAVFEKLANNTTLDTFEEVRKAWQGRYETHSTAKSKLAGYCRLVVAPRAEEGEKQSDVTLGFAAAEINRLARENPGRSVGVLVRRNKVVAQLIYLLRSKHKLQASEEGGNPLIDSVAVRLVLSLLTLADHPGHTAARFHVATSPLGKALNYTDHANATAAAQLAQAIREELIAGGYGRTIYGWVEQLAPQCDQREMSRLMQLVELAYGYDGHATVRPADFVAHVEATKVEDPTAADVRVMTIHQAKGLQFDIVVLPELDVRLEGQKPRVVIGRESPGAPITRVCRYVDQAVQELLPTDVRRMFEQVPYLTVNESLCLLYVAMTRAVHALHMIVAPPAANEKTWPKTYAGILRAAFASGQQKLEPGTVLLEKGDPNCCHADTSAEPPVDEPTIETILVELRPSTQRRRGLDRKSPSSLEGGTKVDLARRLRLDEVQAATRGLLTHAWMERIEWLDDGLPSEAALNERAREFAGQGLDIAAEIVRFMKAINVPAVRETLLRTSYRDLAKLGFAASLSRQLIGREVSYTVWRERTFAVREENTLLQGAIDRLVLIYDGDRIVAADILDFKTDRVIDAAGIEEKFTYYRPQIEAYRRAAARFLHLDPARIGARLVFLEPGIVRIVS